MAQTKKKATKKKTTKKKVVRKKPVKEPIVEKKQEVGVIKDISFDDDDLDEKGDSVNEEGIDESSKEVAVPQVKEEVPVLVDEPEDYYRAILLETIGVGKCNVVVEMLDGKHVEIKMESVINHNSYFGKVLKHPFNSTKFIPLEYRRVISHSHNVINLLKY